MAFLNIYTIAALTLCQHCIFQQCQAFTIPQRSVYPYPKSQLSKLRIFNSQLFTSNEEIQLDNAATTDKAPCYDSICTSNPDDAINPSSSSSSSSSTSPLSASSTSSSPRTGQAMHRLGTSSSGPTVWSEFGRLAMNHPSIANLGQGFPNWLPPQFAIDALVEGATDVAQNSPHQYTRTAGHPKLVQELAGRYSRHLNRDVDPFGQVAVTVGASQALYLALQTLIQPGDEVILFEPFFDLYVNQIKLAGGIPIYVPLTFRPYDDSPDVISGGEWVLHPESLHNAISEKTRAIILNSPHNPTGKIFTRQEMQCIADALENLARDDCVVLSDEVYKYIVHAPPKDEMEREEALQFEKKQQEGRDKTTDVSNNHSNDKTQDPAWEYHPAICQGHVHFASLPGMWERTITISSAGKTFSATGWQVGWAIGPESLIKPMHQLLPYVQFCASTVIQEALARALPRADLPYEGYANYYEYLKAMYTRKRDLLGSALVSAGFGIPNYDETPGGGFFIFARIGKDVANAIPKDRLMAYNPAAPGRVARQDWALCQWLAEEKGILCIPASPFFSEDCAKAGDGQPLSDQFVRIAFCKTNDTIQAAANALMRILDESEEDVTRKEDASKASTVSKQ